MPNISRALDDEPEIPAFAQCWNAGDFFMAHEVLEGLWIRRRDDGLRGLIQLAVALHHIERGNLKGARTMIERARGRLANPANARSAIDLKMMDAYARLVGEALASGDARGAVAARPRL
jgi:predicted metal-dependent hydrolase